MSAASTATTAGDRRPGRRPGRSRASRSRRSSSRDGETDIRVYEGEVEHFVSAQSEGIGIRVIRDGRTGFAYAGTLDAAADRRGAGRGPRQRRRSAPPTSGPAWPSPTVST